MHKKTIAQFEQSERWVRVAPDGSHIGEPQDVNVLVKRITRNNFMITYLSELVSMIDTIGNKKMQVVKYILGHMDISTNKLTETTDEISKACKVSRVCVSRTLQLLEQAGFIARKRGVVMLSPKIAHKGSAHKERLLMTKFREMAGDDDVQDC